MYRLGEWGGASGTEKDDWPCPRAYHPPRAGAIIRGARGRIPLPRRPSTALALMLRRSLVAILPTLLIAAVPPLHAQSLELARGGKTSYTIVVGANPTPPESLAAAELSRYLGAMTGARFPVATSSAAGKAIVIRVAPDVGESRMPTASARVIAEEEYSISVHGDTLALGAASGRAALYAVYDLLERLGCRWLAPELAFYRRSGELVPSRPTLVYESHGAVQERPAMALRTLDVEEGLSHDSASLRRIVEWMPKARYNVLQLPMDFGGSGRVRWDNWRAALTPELERRGIFIEVGGHGYQNFLNASMENGRVFAEHPEWFGRDSSCAPSRSPRQVFNTANADAVRFVIGNVVNYLRVHPEIDIFDFWPPDGARWSDCASLAPGGTPADRQAALVNALHDSLAKAGLPVRVEMIAYSDLLEPPRRVPLNAEVLVAFCPINQSFDAQIFDSTSAGNAGYAGAIDRWRESFTGDVTLYSYYRKYAWRSLPVVLPHYVQRDVAWYAAVPLQGISTYAEPGDWGTYELNHWTLGRLAWSPRQSADSLVGEFAAARYGRAAAVAREALTLLEQTTRVYGTIPFSRRHSAPEMKAARGRLLGAMRRLHAARAGVAAPDSAAIERLELMLEFEARDLEISSLPREAREERVRALVAFLDANRGKGVFLVRDGDLARYEKMYAARPRDRSGS
jgi:hypothetical protein